MSKDRVGAGGVVKEASFVEEQDTDLNEQIDAVHLTRCWRYPTHVAPMRLPKREP